MKKKSLLIVEDEFTVALDLELRLQKMGYSVLALAADPDTALRLTEEERPDLILMDIFLHSDRDGIALAGQIQHNWKIPVVFLTAYSDLKTLERAAHTGAYGYLVKPFKDEDLRSIIEMAWHKHHAIHTDQTLTGTLSYSVENQNSDSFFIRDRQAIYRVPGKDILFLEAADNYTHIYTDSRRFTVHTFLKDVLERLPATRFIRVHRSFAVDYTRIEQIKEDKLYIGAHKIPLSRSYRENLLTKGVWL